MKTQFRSAAGKYLSAFAFALFAGAFAATQAQAQTFDLMYSFTGGFDGGTPLAGLASDSAGNFYGTTSAGGSSGAGAVFQWSGSGQPKVLYSFTGGADGANPEARGDRGFRRQCLWGPPSNGGAHGVAGTVFEVPAGGKEKVLYSFAGGTDGANPEGSLTMNSAGKLYGTTFNGGAYSGGTVFAVTKGGHETVLHSFGQGADGANPVAGVTFGPKGIVLYGTTSAGGAAGAGTVFELAPSASGWTEDVLYNFELQDDGGTPYAGVIFGPSGHLYGAATTGGNGGSNGGGTVFEMTRSSGGWAFKVIYALPGWGLSGTFRDLLIDASGNIYGTTHCDGAYDNGTVYELTPAGGSWTYNSLYILPSSGSDGYYLFSNLAFDKHGSLWGTTSAGGAYGSGVIFKVTP